MNEFKYELGKIDTFNDILRCVKNNNQALKMVTDIYKQFVYDIIEKDTVVCLLNRYLNPDYRTKYIEKEVIQRGIDFGLFEKSYKVYKKFKFSFKIKNPEARAFFEAKNKNEQKENEQNAEYIYNLKIVQELAEMLGLELQKSKVVRDTFEVLNKAGVALCHGGTLIPTYKWLRVRAGWSEEF